MARAGKKGEDDPAVGSGQAEAARAAGSKTAAKAREAAAATDASGKENRSIRSGKTRKGSVKKNSRNG